MRETAALLGLDPHTLADGIRAHEFRASSGLPGDATPVLPYARTDKRILFPKAHVAAFLGLSVAACDAHLATPRRSPAASGTSPDTTSIRPVADGGALLAEEGCHRESREMESAGEAGRLRRTGRTGSAIGGRNIETPQRAAGDRHHQRTGAADRTQG